MRYMIQSSTDGVVWETRDTCENEKQYTSSVESLEVFDDVLSKYRVIDNDTSTVVFEQPSRGPEAA